MGKNKESADIEGGSMAWSYIYKRQDDGSSISIGSLATLTAAMDAEAAENGIGRSLYKVGLKLLSWQQSQGNYMPPLELFPDNYQSVHA